MNKGPSYRRVLVDTGPLVAIANPNDAQHAGCVQVLPDIEPPLLTCWPVLTEAAWLLRRHQAAWNALVKGLHRQLFVLLPVEQSELGAVSGLMAQYRNLPLQLADAVLLHLANREGLTTVFTLDQRDFSVVRLRGKKRLTLLPVKN